MDPLAAIGCQEDADIRLDLAALELAAADRPRADLEPHIAFIESLASQLHAPISGSAARAEALAALIAKAENFTGDAEDYDAPCNADFISVLERRRGLPIALAILYVALAGRVGWQARVLGLAGHVLVAVGGEADAAFIDAFHHGRLVDPNTLPSRDVAILDNRATLVRLVGNAASRACAAGDDARALTLYRRLTLIAPAEPSLWWERARLERKVGDRQAARRSLAAMAETTHDPALELRIRAAYVALTR